MWSGPVIVGNVGSRERLDYRAVGDPLNTAKRLEDANRFRLRWLPTTLHTSRWHAGAKTRSRLKTLEREHPDDTLVTGAKAGRLESGEQGTLIAVGFNERDKGDKPSVRP